MTEEQAYESIKSSNSRQAVLLGIIAHVLDYHITEQSFEGLERMIKNLKEIRVSENWS